MTTTEEKKGKLGWLVAEPLVLTIIGINVVTLFLSGFPAIQKSAGVWIGWVDYTCLIYFIAEAIIKIRQRTFASYWERGWNRLDLFIVICSSPMLLAPFLGDRVEFFSIMLVGRTLRLLRVMRFVPNSDKIWAGIIRALKASAAVFLTLFVLNLILAMGANVLFSEVSPKHFGDPLQSAYSLFKVFTIEGWYEIPEAIAAGGAEKGIITLVKGYFVIAVLVGGILGLSLANAVFVDEMTADNNDRLEQIVTDLREELATKQEADEATRLARWDEVDARLREIKEQLSQINGRN